MGAEEGWWEVSGSEIDFMPESDTAPRKEKYVWVCLSACRDERESSLDSGGSTMAEEEEQKSPEESRRLASESRSAQKKHVAGSLVI